MKNKFFMREFCQAEQRVRSRSSASLKNNKGEGYVEVAVAVLVIAFVLLLTISIFSMITLKQDLKYMCRELVEVATVTGGVTDAVYQRYDELSKETGLNPTVYYSAVYFDRATGKVQLGDAISCTLTADFTLPGFGGYTFPFSVEATESGLSRVYWK